MNCSKFVEYGCFSIYLYICVLVLHTENLVNCSKFVEYGCFINHILIHMCIGLTHRELGELL